MGLLNSRKLSWIICGVGFVLTTIIYFFMPSMIPIRFSGRIADFYLGGIEIFLFPLLQLIILYLSGRERIKYFLTHSKAYVTDFQYNWVISGLCLFLLAAEILEIRAPF